MSDVVPFVDLKMQYRSIEREVRDAMTAVLEDAAFVMGPDVRAFESEFAAFIGIDHCVGVESGTAALKLALEALEIGEGDEVIIPANTYVACAFAVSSTGAVPVMADVNESYLMQAGAVEAAITPRTRAIMPVHLYGQAADLDPILKLANAHGLKVIEDASQAHGAMYRTKRTGSFGDVGTFSFYPAKNLGAYGDAGAVVTNDPAIADRLRLLQDFGQRKKYEHLILADNCRLDTLQAAVLRVKLRRLDAWNSLRRDAAKLYDDRIRAIGLEPPICNAAEGHVYHLYVVQVPERERAIASLARSGVQAGIHYPFPVHLQPAYRHLGIEAGSYPRTEAAAARILSLPMFPEITQAQIERVTQALKAHLDEIRVATS